MMVSNIPWNISVSGAIVLVKLVKEIPKWIAVVKMQKLKAWNDHWQSEWIFTIFSLATLRNKLKLSQVGFEYTDISWF